MSFNSTHFCNPPRYLPAVLWSGFIESGSNPDPIRIQGFDEQKFKEKKYNWNFFIKNCNLLKDVYAAVEVFSPQKKTSCKHFKNFFLFLWLIFALLGPDPIQIQIQMRIRFHNTAFQYWLPRTL